MPTITFENLPDHKRLPFIEVALEEFAAHNYDVASVNRIVKRLGIARGSVYQYFTDKLDLWTYLRQYAAGKKMAFLATIDRATYADFWSYYRALYHRGVCFEIAHPRCSRLLYRIGYQENSPALKARLDTWKQQSKAVLTTWVEAEQQQGEIDPQLAPELVAHYLLTMGIGVADWLQERYNIDENLAQGKPMLGDDLTDYYQAIDDLIGLLKKSLQP